MCDEQYLQSCSEHCSIKQEEKFSIWMQIRFLIHQYCKEYTLHWRILL